MPFFNGQFLKCDILPVSNDPVFYDYDYDYDYGYVYDYFVLTLFMTMFILRCIKHIF